MHNCVNMVAITRMVNTEFRGVVPVQEGRRGAVQVYGYM